MIPSKPTASLPSDTQFTNWLDNLGKKFSSLNNHEKKVVLSALHGACAPFKPKELADALDKLSKRDFLALLPPEVSCMILDYLDHSSLGCSATVSRRWNFIITTHDMLWLKALNAIKLYPPLMQNKLRFMSPYKLFSNYKRKVKYFKDIGCELHCPAMEEVNHAEDFDNVKDVLAASDGHLVLGYMMRQPHNIYQKYQVSKVSSTKILSSIKTIHAMDSRINNKFLFCSTNSGRWVCYSWRTRKEIYSIHTYGYSFEERRFPAFAEACERCPVMAVFDTNRCQFNPDGASHNTIYILGPHVNEHCELEFGIRMARIKLYVKEEWKIIVQQAIISSGSKFYHGDEHSEYMPCSKHKMIFQQQNYKFLIYELDTHHRSGPCSLFPVLLHTIDPFYDLDFPNEPFDPVRNRLSRDKSIVGYTNGPNFCWMTFDGSLNRLSVVEGSPYLTTVAVGNVFSLLAVVTTEFYRYIVVETGNGNIVKIFADLTPIQGTEPRRYHFNATFLHLDWLDDVTDSPELNCETLALSAAAYSGGFGIWYFTP